jgi:hypothetical protein
MGQENPIRIDHEFGQAKCGKLTCLHCGAWVSLGAVHEQHLIDPRFELRDAVRYLGPCPGEKREPNGTR